MKRYIHTSLTSIAPFVGKSFDQKVLPHEEWQNGDYVVAKVIAPSSPHIKIELTNGRMINVIEGDLLVGALGVRHATLEATGTWKAVGTDGKMCALTGAGLFGKLTSKSTFLGDPIEIQYLGHVYYQGERATMKRYAAKNNAQKYDIPVVLLVGTSMSSGKTTAARIVTNELIKKGLTVVNAKLTGAGRYRDILAVGDVGSDYIYDFVDVGLPSSICPKEEYLEALHNLLGLMATTRADIAVVEIGASPLEPYNGDVAIEAIKEHICFTILCASDPYAVFGVMKSYDFKPDLTTGIATNTIAGIELVEKLCKVKALNIIEPQALPELRKMLDAKLTKKTLA